MTKLSVSQTASLRKQVKLVTENGLTKEALLQIHDQSSIQDVCNYVSKYATDYDVSIGTVDWSFKKANKYRGFSLGEKNVVYLCKKGFNPKHPLCFVGKPNTNRYLELVKVVKSQNESKFDINDINSLFIGNDTFSNVELLKKDLPNYIVSVGHIKGNKEKKLVYFCNVAVPFDSRFITEYRATGYCAEWMTCLGHVKEALKNKESCAINRNLICDLFIGQSIDSILIYLEKDNPEYLVYFGYLKENKHVEKFLFRKKGTDIPDNFIFYGYNDKPQGSPLDKLISDIKDSKELLVPSEKMLEICKEKKFENILHFFNNNLPENIISDYGFLSNDKERKLFYFREAKHPSNPNFVGYKENRLNNVIETLLKSSVAHISYDKLMSLFEGAKSEDVLEYMRYNVPSYNSEIGFIGDEKMFLFWKKEIEKPEHFIIGVSVDQLIAKIKESHDFIIESEEMFKICGSNVVGAVLNYLREHLTDYKVDLGYFTTGGDKRHYFYIRDASVDQYRNFRSIVSENNQLIGILDKIRINSASHVNYDAIMSLFKNEKDAIEYFNKNLPQFNIATGFILSMSKVRAFLFWHKNIEKPSHWLFDSGYSTPTDMDNYVVELTKDMDLEEINDMMLALGKIRNKKASESESVKCKMLHLLKEAGFTDEEIKTLN